MQATIPTQSERGEYFLFQLYLYETAIEYFEKAVKYNPSDQAYYRLGQAYMYGGLNGRNWSYVKKGGEMLQKAIAMDGGNAKYARDEFNKLQRFLNRN